MLRNLLVVACFTAVAACASKSAPVSPATGGAAARGAPTGCEKEIMLTCDRGLVDGCTVLIDGEPATLHHICVPDDTKAAPPCEQEIARECPEGLIDACLTDPPSSKQHVCVSRA